MNKQNEKYKTMLKRKNKEKKIYKDKNVSLQLDKQRLYIALRNREQEIERLNNIINEAKEFIYENAYDEERKICIDDLWGEIPKLLEILDKVGSEKE